MLTQKQILEIREHLEKAQNPLFFFDNDNDGLTSFLQLQRFIGRGKGISIKSFPDLNISYFRRITELNPDYIFILDKAVVSDKFLDRIKQEIITKLKNQKTLTSTIIILILIKKQTNQLHTYHIK